MRSVVYYVGNLAITLSEPMPKLRHQMTDNIQLLGNAALMALPKVAFLSSRRVAPAAVMRCYDWATEMRGGGRGAPALPVAATSATTPAGCVIGGFQSALERDVLKLLLPAGGPSIVMALARGMWRSVPMEYREAINSGRMLVVSPFSQGVVRVSKETAERRNGWILDYCDEVVFASLDPNGSLARLVANRPDLRYQVL